MKIRLAEAARDDLRRIVRTTAVVDPDKASELNRELRTVFRVVADAPFQCSIVHGSRSPGVRKKPLRPHLVLFQVNPGEIMILRIVHERSDWTSFV